MDLLLRSNAKVRILLRNVAIHETENEISSYRTCDDIRDISIYTPGKSSR